uniref:Neural cell adhesion molecule L1.1-like n=1 Tax=Poecilia latipinna TaxID=48699 RepID=A0A3B3TTM8_9TELE
VMALSSEQVISFLPGLRLCRPTPRVEWQKTDGDLKTTSASLDSFDRWLYFNSITEDDDGEYRCRAHNDHGNATHSFTVTVEAAPYWVKKFSDMMYAPGETVRLDCLVKGNPEPTITWRINGEPLTGGTQDPRRSVAGSTLILRDVVVSDTAIYQCEATNVHGSILQNINLFVVELPPQILSSDGIVYKVFEGEQVNMDCESFDACELLTGATFGPAAPPDPPTSVSLSSIEDYSATLSWIPGSSHNSPITEFIVEAEEKPQTDSGAAAWTEWTTIPGDFRLFQLSLQPFCWYRFRVAAVNELGQSKASEPTKLHSTPAAAPRSNPTNVRSNSTEPGVLLITWDEMEKRLHNGQDFQYRVYWREADSRNAEWNWAYAKSPPFTVNDTGTFTPFEIKVQAVNAIDSGPAPEAKTGHSGEDKPEEPPTGVAFSVMNSTVRVTWNEAQNVRGHLLGYRVRLLTANYSRSSLSYRINTEKFGFSRLTSDCSALLLGAFVFTAPGPPASLTFESPTETSLILHWSPPHEVNGELQSYKVQYQQGNSSQMEIPIFNVFFNVNQFELMNLDPSSYYLFKVIACTAAGCGPPITRRGATLMEGAPPTNITVVSSVTSFNLSWVPEDRHRNHGFHIHYLRKSAGGQWEKSELINSTQGFYSLTGLQPGTEYSLRILHDNNTHWQEMLRTVGPVPSEMPGRFATQGWLIGLISAIVLLILILLILCLIKRSRGGKYAVKDKEKKEIDFDLQNKDETFGEYRSLESDGDEKRSDSQQSLCDDSKLGSEDSLAEYGDSVDIQFNEDGSFIGQYSGRSAAAPHGSSGPASPLNPAPPPPFAPSMSGILNRPS